MSCTHKSQRWNNGEPTSRHLADAPDLYRDIMAWNAAIAADPNRIIYPPYKAPKAEQKRRPRKVAAMSLDGLLQDPTEA